MEGAIDDDEDDNPLIGNMVEAVNDMASSVTDAETSAAMPSEEDKMTVMDLPLVADAAAMPMPPCCSKEAEGSGKTRTGQNAAEESNRRKGG
jgi:hypothetical protein